MRCWKPASRSCPRRNAPPPAAAPAWTPPRCRCSPAARPGAPACRPATPTAAGTSARATTASARTTRASRCARSAGRWKPPSPPPPGRLTPSPAARTWPSAWPWPGPAKTPAAPAPGCWPPSPPAATRPAGSATTAPKPPRSPGGSTSRPGRWATPRSWTTAPTSSASRPIPAAPSSSRAPGTALPGPLITATTGLRDHAITRELYDQQITARCPYQLKHKDGPDADGYQRLTCPAAGHHPGLICPLRKASLTPRDGRPKVLQPPQEPPRLCRQTAITIAPDVGARYRQDLPYGSPAWHARYATLRNTIEGLNGLVKDTAHEALAAPARRRVRGIAACSLFTALLLMAANIRKIRAWRALTAAGKAGIAHRARRRRASLRDYLPDG